MVKKQVTYSMSLILDEWLTKIFNENKKRLELLGINNKTKLLEVLARNGETTVYKLLDALDQIKSKESPNT
ncbi:MAG: hypothetical protein ACQCN5_07565 [Candidatus Bathyarchaeia archaeon]